MRKLLFVLLFCLPLTVAAQEYFTDRVDRETSCTIITVRFASYLTLAQVIQKESDFKTLMYNQIKDFDVDRDTKMLLTQLVDLAWLERDKDLDLTALAFYKTCLKTFST